MKNNLKNIFEGGKERNFPTGQILLYEGDKTDNLFFIAEGYVKLYNIQDNGTEQIIFIDGPGDAFPLTSYLSGSYVARYFYECMVDCKLLSISSDELDKKIHNNLDLADALMRYTTEMSQQFMQRIEILSVNDARRKIVSLLSFLEKKSFYLPDSHMLDIPMTHQDIAAMCGMSRETASIQLAKLKKDGVVRGSRHLIINPVKLKKLKEQLSINF